MNETEKTVNHIKEKAEEEITFLKKRLKTRPAAIFPLAQKMGGKSYYMQFFTLALGPELFFRLGVGDLVREAQRELSQKEAAAALKKELGESVVGELASPTQKLLADKTIFALFLRELKKCPPGKSLIVDGLPRRKTQAERLLRLKKRLEKKGTPVFFILFKTPKSVLKIRMAGRRLCPGCGLNKNIVSAITSKVKYKKGEFVLVCDHCGEEMEKKQWSQGRVDEMTAAVLERQRLYRQMVSHLKKKVPASNLITINTACPTDQKRPPREINKTYHLSYKEGKILKRKRLQIVKSGQKKVYTLSPEGVVPEVIKALGRCLQTDEA